jgi:hypothetical protein
VLHKPIPAVSVVREEAATALTHLPFIWLGATNLNKALAFAVLTFHSTALAFGYVRHVSGYLEVQYNG